MGRQRLSPSPLHEDDHLGENLLADSIPARQARSYMHRSFRTTSAQVSREISPVRSVLPLFTTITRSTGGRGSP